MRPPLAPPQFHTWTLSDGYSLKGRLWMPEPFRRAHGYAESQSPTVSPTKQPAQRIILYLHGIQSHGGWFEWSASRLAAAGNVVLFPDRRGSGLNAVDRGDTPNVRRWLCDLDELADWAVGTFPHRPLDVVGVSWGGKLAVAWCLVNPRRVHRLLLIAPGIFPAVYLDPLTLLDVLVSTVIRPRRLVPIPLNDPELFTDNPAGQHFITSDPLRLTDATARFFFASWLLDRHVARAHRRSLRPSVTLLLAGRERIIRNAPTVRRLNRLAAQPPAVRMFPNACHTIEFEHDPAEFAAVLDAWASMTQ